MSPKVEQVVNETVDQLRAAFLADDAQSATWLEIEHNPALLAILTGGIRTGALAAVQRITESLGAVVLEYTRDEEAA